MQTQWLILISLYTLTNCQNKQLLTRTHTINLKKYTEYYDASILLFKIPYDIHAVQFQFQAELHELSIFKCSVEDVTLYLKYGSPPVINPDGSKFPEGFLKSGRPELHLLQFKSDNAKQYINITSPLPGTYYAAAFISYTDPDTQGITQKGLTPDCLVYLNTAVYVDQKPTANVLMANRNVHVLLLSNMMRLYKFFVPVIADSAILTIKEIHFCENCTELQIRIQALTIPDQKNSLHDIQLTKEDYDEKTFSLRFMTIENSWYYLSFTFKDKSSASVNETAEFLFKLSYQSSLVITPGNATQNLEVKTKVIEESWSPALYNGTANNSIPFKHSILRHSQDELFSYSMNTYKQYTLMRESYSDDYMFSFDLQTLNGSKTYILNVTDTDVSVLKFNLNEGVDIGGTLQFSLAFKPRVKMVEKTATVEEEPEGNTIIACLWNGAKAVPIWPNSCGYNGKIVETPIVINKTVDNHTVYIPYPEPGEWYISVKLFCEPCAPCKCSDDCKKQHKQCSTQCEMNCENSTSCDLCIENCERSLKSKKECDNCDCEGPCQRRKLSCSSGVVFDLSAHLCVGGRCGTNGRCVYQVSGGLAYSVCLCSNRYKGWDCTDDSQTNSNAAILLELLLLVLSNLLFLPAVYAAYRRGYYVEAIVYFSTCFFSTFYHACDAGENIYRLCIVKLPALQFGDFFCGLLSIWVTMIAMAYLQSPWTHISHISGAILLSFFTTINKTALWVFALPFVTGLVILIVSWHMQYRKTGRIFPSKRYLFIIFPAGLVTVTVGLLVYALLQTKQNYKYLHSMWHMMMAVAIIVLLPNKRSFLPSPIAVDSEESLRCCSN